MKKRKLIKIIKIVKTQKGEIFLKLFLKINKCLKSTILKNHQNHKR
jgi:hypothetical protein